jgi:peptidoglycan/LPS O-acetylase OafA/YrhL
LVTKERFYRPELDALRFGAFAMVFIAHMCQSLAVDMYAQGGFSRLLEEASIGGLYGVDVFFLLSAYLICELFRRERNNTGGIDIQAFYWRRVLRIWPLCFTFIFIVAIGAIVIPLIKLPQAALLSLIFFYSNWYRAWHVAFPPIDILWSVSAEEQFYLLCPWAMRWLTPRNLTIAAGCLVLMAFAVRAQFIANEYGTAIWFHPLTRIDPIAIGTATALILRGRIPKFPASFRIVLLAVGISFIELAAIHFHGPSGDRLTLATVFIAYALSDSGILLIFLSVLGARIEWSPLLYLGRISFGLYVFHALWLDATKVGLLHFFNECPWWARGGIALPLTIACAAISYRWLETPFLNLKRKFSRYEVGPSVSGVNVALPMETKAN